MCECGCPGTWTRYRFPAPKRAFYLLTLMGPCTNCDGSSGFTIELIEPGSFEHGYYSKDYPEALDGELAFEKWGNGNLGVGFDTGMRKHEFIDKLMPHLIGVDSRELGEKGKIDKFGADAILEEMYDDAQVKPALRSGPSIEKEEQASGN